MRRKCEMIHGLMSRGYWHNQLAMLTLILCIMLSLASRTVTLSTEVMRTNDGKNPAPMHPRYEFDPDAYRALQDYSPSAATGNPSTLDERDPDLIRYSFDASMQATKEPTNPFPLPDPKDSSRYIKWQRLDSAIKATGPDELIFFITQAGTKGDCDGDGRITEVDALCALEMSTRMRPTDLIVDMDNSGDVTSRDAVIILQIAIGKIVLATPTPTGTPRPPTFTPTATATPTRTPTGAPPSLTPTATPTRTSTAAPPSPTPTATKPSAPGTESCLPLTALSTADGKLDPFTFAVSRTADDEPFEPKTRIPEGARRVFGFYSFEGMRNGTTVLTLWCRDGNVYLRSQSNWDAGASGGAWTLLELPDGLPVGEYELRIYVASRLAQFGKFTIEKATGAPYFTRIQFAEGQQDLWPLSLHAPNQNFGYGIKAIYAFREGWNLPQGARLRGEWYLNGELYVSREETWNGVAHTFWNSVLDTTNAPLARGTYEFRQYLNGQLAQSGTAVVQ